MFYEIAFMFVICLYSDTPLYFVLIFGVIYVFDFYYIVRVTVKRSS